MMINWTNSVFAKVTSSFNLFILTSKTGKIKILLLFIRDKELIEEINRANKNIKVKTKMIRK